MYNFKIDHYLKIIFFISLLSLTSAFFIEYILGHQPCNLCLIQRIPYALSIILILLLNFHKKNEKFTVLLLILAFSFSFLMSFYHLGIEQGFFKESSVCSVINTSEIITKEELLKQLQIKSANCKDVTFKIFGFSLTAINMILSLFLTVLLINIFKNYEKFKK